MANTRNRFALTCSDDYAKLVRCLAAASWKRRVEPWVVVQEAWHEALRRHSELTVATMLGSLPWFVEQAVQWVTSQGTTEDTHIFESDVEDCGRYLARKQQEGLSPAAAVAAYCQTFSVKPDVRFHMALRLGHGELAADSLPAALWYLRVNPLRESLWKKILW
jgi:hypothetical protein